VPRESVQPYRVRRDGPELEELRQRLNQWITAHVDERTHTVEAVAEPEVGSGAVMGRRFVVDYRAASAQRRGDPWPAIGATVLGVDTGDLGRQPLVGGGTLGPAGPLRRAIRKSPDA
jgi:hypothetical protein